MSVAQQDPYLEALPITRKRGNEPFHSRNVATEFALIDFWQWGTSDLVSNSTRGHLAEFLIAKALGIDHGTRVEWDAYDLVTASGLKIEVKSCAYLQTWRQLKLSPISFAIPFTHAWDEAKRAYSDTPLRQADLYIFALLTHTEKSTVNPLDLDQWHFYVVPTAELREIKTARLTLKKLESLGHKPVHWKDLAQSVSGFESRRGTALAVP